MNKTNNPSLTANAKMLRKNMTKEERHLWYDVFYATVYNCINKDIDMYLSLRGYVINT